MRKLTKTIALVSLMAPASAFPLGVGDIKLHSALNQNLDAEITLLVSGNESLSDIKVKLASPDKFDEAGVPWSYFLSKIKFDLTTRPDGSAIVKLSSSEALSEPFLDFLLEVTWPKGNLYREFTVLVDPPATYQQPVIPVSTDTGVSQAAQDYARTVGKTPATLAESQSSAAVYGPVSHQDTLWTIAAKVNTYNDVSVEQVIMALYEANPKAFYKDNINALAAGVTLNVPDKEAILKISRKQALAQFTQQTQAWNGRPAATTKTSQASAQADTGNQLKLLPPAQDNVAEDEIVVSGEHSDVRPAPGVAELPQEQEAASVESAGNTDLQERLEKLEQQLTLMQQMLALKDEQLASLQNKQALDAEAENSQQAPEKQAVAVDKTPLKPQQPVVKKPEPTKPKRVVQTEPEADGFSDWYFWLLGALGLGALGGAGWIGWRKRRMEEANEAASMFAASSEISLPNSDSQLNISVMEDETAYDVGTVGESSFLSEFTPSDLDAFDSDQHEVDPISEADVYLAYGRYQQAEELIRHAIGESPNNDEYKLKLLEIFYANENKEAFESYAKELAEVGKTSVTTFWDKVAEMGNEICPDSSLFSGASNDYEGQNNSSDQAGSFKRTEEPEAGDIGNNADLDFDLSSFDSDDVSDEKPADSQKGDLEQTDDKNTDGNLNLDFDVSSFDSDEESAAAKAELEFVDDDKASGDLDLDLSEFAIDDEVSVQNDLANQRNTDNKTQGDHSAFDLDLASLDLPSFEEPAQAKETNVSFDNGLDFDLSSFDFDVKDTVAEKTQPQEPRHDEHAIDFDLTLDEKPAQESEPKAALDAMESLDFDFNVPEATQETDKSGIDGFDQAVDKIETTTASKSVLEGDDVSDFEFNFDFDETAPEKNKTDDLSDSLDFGVSDLTDMDEFETKIDLARAYIDMGDAEAAKDIAEEVMKKGNAEQKSAAQSILDELM